MPHPSDRTIMSQLRAALYHALAEALSEPPGWLARSGEEWPLTDAARRLASLAESAHGALAALVAVPAEPLSARRERYAALFAGPERPRFWLYESMQVSGRLLGPEALAVEKIYRAAGLQIAGAELPDHASVELAFLARLAEQQAMDPARSRQWRQLEQRFAKRHAGRWLPDLGNSLANSGDNVYAPIGRLLAGWLDEILHPRRRHHKAGRRSCIPRLPLPDKCTLCGFCVQICPTRALAIDETENTTTLILSPAACVGCGKCERICETAALRMEHNTIQFANSMEWTTLRRSPRAICPGCKRGTVSQAEMEHVASQIGRPLWLAYCLDCRAHLLENPL